MVYGFGCRIDNDSNMITTVDESTLEVTTTGYINGVPFEGGGGGGDYSTATLSFTGESDQIVKLYAPCVYEDDGLIYASGIDARIDDNIDIVIGSDGTAIFTESEATLTVSGNITDDGDGYYTVTGDCAITIS